MHTPPLPLGKFVENIVYYEGYAPEHSMEKLLPDGSVSIIVDMEETPKKLFRNEDLSKYTEFRGAYVSGQHKGFMHIEAAQGMSMMVVRFHLGGAYPFFEGTMSTLNNRVVQLETLWGNAIEETRRKIIAEKDIAEKFRLMENYLLSRMKENYIPVPQFENILEYLKTTPHGATTKVLAEKMGVSQKHLISLFDKKVGLTPKALARIFRFQKVVAQIEEQKQPDWMQIATDCGYYDQAHFAKDFYSFSGINPSSYPSQRGEYLNYIPVK